MVTGLQRCNSAHDTREDLDSAISGLRESGKVTLGAPGSPPRTIRPGQEDFFLAFLTDNFDYCEGIDRETRETYFGWAIKGAGLGDDFTIGVVSTEMPEGSEKFDFLQSTWNQYKNDGIALRLSEYHLNGVPTDNGELSSPDYKSAYSFLLVHESFMNRNLDITNTHRGVQNIASTEIQDSKDRITIHLSLQDTLEAEETAIAMIAEVEGRRKDNK